MADEGYSRHRTVARWRARGCTDRCRPQKVFYDGQIYDAFEQMKKFVRMAKKELIVIDPYFADSVLPLVAQKHGEYAIVEMCKCASMKTANAA